MNWVLAGQTNMLGSRFATGLTLRPVAPPPPAFTPASLFAAGEQGVWYDPSDLTTMFTDSAGTTPVGTPGDGSAQPVGLLLDKSQNYQGISGLARYNLLTYSEQFDNAAWNKNNISVVADATTAPDGTNTADKIVPSTSNAYHFTDRLNTITASAVSYTGTIYAKASGYNYLIIGEQNGPHWAYFNLSNGTTGSTSGAGVASSIVSVGSGWYRCTIVYTSTGGSRSLFFAVANTDPGSIVTWTGDGTSGIYIWGADLRLSSQAALTPTYQPITSSWIATLAGNHATQSTASSRPTLSALYNLLTYTEQFDNGFWNKNHITVTANATTAPDGTTTADKITPSTSSAIHYTDTSISVVATAYVASVYAKASGYNFIVLGEANGSNWSYFDVSSGSLGSVNGTVTNRSITAVGNGWYRCTFTSTPAARSNGGIFVVVAASDTGNGTLATWSGNGTDGILVWGADYRFDNDGVGLPAYQRVVDANTYDSTGFPYYLKADGVDDGEVTSSIDFSGTNKVTVFAGLRKLSDSALASVAELSATIASNNGSFLLSAPNSAAANYNFSSKGTTQVDNTVTTYTSPITSIVTGIGDISAPNNQIRVNASLAGTQIGSQGTGNYGNYVLYLFRRGGSSAPFNGRTYGMIVRGASSTATEITNTETWLNGKTKAY